MPHAFVRDLDHHFAINAQERNVVHDPTIRSKTATMALVPRLSWRKVFGMQAGALVRVFIASPGDVTPEREEACRVISDWNAAHSISRAVLIEPVRVETHARLVQGGHPQDIINGQLLKQCDILLAIFWHRLGTPTEKANSGTIQEIVEFSDLKGPDRVILMFCDRSLPNDVDIQQLEAVRKFRRQGSDKGLYKTFSDTAEFSRLFSQQ